jgi:bifunctional non-homologous end joining protein LigD
MGRRGVKSGILRHVAAENATTWLIPKLVGEVKFTEWTSEDEMRHPAFLRLRSDKEALDVIREQA